MEKSETPLLELYMSYDQWKEEHEALHARLRELSNLMRWNPGNFDYPSWGPHLHKVHVKFVSFMEVWQNHLVKERKIMYPIARFAICGGRMGPVAVLEQEAAIAGNFYDAYLQAMEQEEPPEECLSLLHQVLMIIAEHFRVEDEMLVPAAERLMDEIEYSGS